MYYWLIDFAFAISLAVGFGIFLVGFFHLRTKKAKKAGPELVGLPFLGALTGAEKEAAEIAAETQENDATEAAAETQENDATEAAAETQENDAAEAAAENRDKQNKAKFFLALSGFYALGIILVWYLSDFSGKVWEMDWNAGMVVFLFILWHAGLSVPLPRAKGDKREFRALEAGEIGAVEFWRRPIFSVGPGFLFVPRLIFQLSRGNGLPEQKEVPGEPEEIYREPEQGTIPEGTIPRGTLPKGMVPPLRITFGGSPYVGGESILERNPLTEQMSQEVSVVFQWRIKRLSVFSVSIGTKEAVNKQLEDLVISSLNEEFGKVTLAHVIKNLEYYSYKLLRAAKNKTRGWGIEILSARLKNPVLSRSLSKALQEKAEAIAWASATITKAQGTQLSDEFIGKGKAAVALSLMTAETKGLQERADSLKVSGAGVLSAQTIERMTDTATTFVVPGFDSISNLLERLTDTFRDTPVKGGKENEI